MRESYAPMYANAQDFGDKKFWNQSRFAVRNSNKRPNQDTGLSNRGHLKVKIGPS